MSQRESKTEQPSGPATTPPPNSAEPGPDHSAADELFERIRRKPERVIGPAGSLVLHAILLIVAAALVINPPIREGEGPGEVPVEFAMMNDEQLSEMETEFDTAVSPIDLSETEVVEPEELAFDADATETEFEPAETELSPLGGAGDAIDSESVLGGGGGGTRFFGVEARGKRFLYIVDVSGSMFNEGRLTTLKDNLLDSVNMLESHTMYYAIAFSSGAQPMDDRGWIKANNSGKAKMRAWVRTLAAAGSTNPATAFEIAFELEPRPDIIYFMTDGDIHKGESVATMIEQLNSKGRKTRIHTIGFGYQGSEDLLRRIARESGGRYRYVPSGGDG
ncbi:MAG: VWA domain-containing protein [Phycisphaerales bacterium]